MYSIKCQEDKRTLTTKERGVFMNEAISVLMRQGMGKGEASSLLESSLDEVTCCVASGDFELAEEIFASDTGLDIDYLINCLI